MELTIDKLTAEQLKRFNPELYEAIKSEADPEKEIADLKDQLQEKETVNEKHKEKRTKLHGKLEKANQRIEELKDKVDKFEAEKALAEKEVLVSEKLKEADLPEDVVTEHWKSKLSKLSEEDIDAEIADRKEMAEKKKGKVEGMGDESDLGKENEKDLEESDKDNIRDAFGVPKQK